MRSDQVTADGAITGVVLERGPETVEVEAPVVVSNVGPWRTAALVGEENLPEEYRRLLDDA